MYPYIRETLISLAELIIITGLALHVLPGEQYQKYIKLLVGIVMIAFLLDAGTGIKGKPLFQQFEVTKNYNEKLNNESEKLKKIEESQYSGALSTYENKIKEKLNKLEYKDGLSVNDVKMDICDDVDNVDYGKITSLKVNLSKNVDKSVNIVVNSVIIGNMSKKSDNLENEQLRERIARELGLEKEVIHVVIS